MGSTRTIRCVAHAIVAAGLLVALTAVLAAPAGARVDAKNTKFCEIFYSDQGAGIDFEGLEPPEAQYAATLMRKLAKTGVPASFKKDLKKLAKVYQRIADGEPAGTVITEDQAFIGKALTRLSKYVGKNCAPAVPGT